MNDALKAKITIVGAGTMGANIALDFSSHGFSAGLIDTSKKQLDRARSLITGNAGELKAHGVLAEATARILERITFSEDLSAAAGSDWVIEAVPETLSLKQRLFSELEAACPTRTVFASNTSTLLPSMIARNLKHPERLLVAHYWNPAHLLPLVELVPHPRTDRTVLERTRVLLQACGKLPVVLKKEVPGFIGNRLAFALQREAMSIVAQGVASPEEVDTVAMAGFGRRIPVSGIFGTADLGGLDVYAAICNLIFPDLSAEKETPAVLKELVAKGRLGVKSGAGWWSYSEAEINRRREALGEELIRYARQDRQPG